MTLQITDNAAAHINTLLTEENSAFRIAVEGGGCSGFQYKFSVDAAEPSAQDLTFTHNDATVVVDDISLGLIKGSELDYVETLGHSGFEIKNPQSTSQCGCGSSFSIV